MTILRNKSGGAASLFSIGAIGIADDGDFDTEAVTNGQPEASAAKVQSSGELRQAIDSDLWVVVSGGVELSKTESLLAVTSGDERTIDVRAPQYETGTLAGYVSGTDVTIRSWTIDAGTQLSIVLDMFDIAGPADTSARGGVYTGLGKGARLGVASAILIGSTVTGSENLPGDRLFFDVDGNDIRLRFRVRLAGDLPWSMSFRAEPKANP